jgi:hypothetical protein
MSEVAVIGCGPAGLLAAHAVALEGHTPVVFSKEAIKSPNARATFLQAPIPDLTSQEPDSTVRIGTIGSAEGYAQKVYGDPSRRTSWSRYSQERERGAWALAPVYADLWDLYQGSVREVEVTYGIASAIKEDHRLVINAPRSSGRSSRSTSTGRWATTTVTSSVRCRLARAELRRGRAELYDGTEPLQRVVLRFVQRGQGDLPHDQARLPAGRDEADDADLPGRGELRQQSSPSSPRSGSRRPARTTAMTASTRTRASG